MGLVRVGRRVHDSMSEERTIGMVLCIGEDKGWSWSTRSVS